MLGLRQELDNQSLADLDQQNECSKRLDDFRGGEADVRLSSGVERRQISLYNLVASLVAIDVVAITSSGIVVDAALNQWRGAEAAWVPAQIGVVVFSVCLYPFIATTFRLYQVEQILNSTRQIRRLLLSVFVTFALMGMVGAAAKSVEAFSRLWFFGWFLLTAGVLVVSRKVVINRVRAALIHRAYVFKAISVGVACPPLSKREIARRSHNEVHVVSEQRKETFEGLASLSDLIADSEADRVYITAQWDAIPALLRKLDLLRHLSTEVLVLPGDRSMRSDLTHVAFFGDRLSFKTLEQPIHGWSLWGKRAEDVIVAALGLLIASPLLLAVAAAIKLESPGPVFFYQQRVGFNGRLFRLRKFRSMYVEQTDQHAARQTTRDDPRVTRVGRIIRQFSIDELPQLLNVLEGSMSVVGPRPHALQTRTEGRNLEELVDYYAVRHRVKPGLTGLAQVAGYRGELDTLEKLQRRVDCDIDYINHWTPWLDIKIILRTLLILFRDKRAY
jgi:polysaccharide biosynthesis protein PslA